MSQDIDKLIDFLDNTKITPKEDVKKSSGLSLNSIVSGILPTIVLVGVIGVVGFFAWYKFDDQDGEDIDVNVSVATMVEKAENNNSEAKAYSHLAIVEMVKTGDISSTIQLKDSLQKMIRDGNIKSFEKVAQLDEVNIPDSEKFTEEEKDKILKYFSEKSKGYMEASK